MIPVLYDKRETDFDSMGIGVLRDTISCVVTEERNGLFEMTMKYPVSGEYFSEIGLESIIVCDASPILTNQQFVVAKITRPINKVVTIYAEHVSQYKTKTTTLLPDVSFNGNAKKALTTWNESLLINQNFTVDSDIGTTMQGHWTIDKVENSRRALGGVEGSILDLYGGEYLFDNNKIKLLKNRGVDRGVYISYGRNLTTIEQEEAITDTVTSIQPFVTYFVDGGTEEKTLTLPENIIHSEYVNNYAKPKILRIDFSGEEIKTVDALRARAERYILENKVGVPKVNLTVGFVDLTQTIEYQNQDVYEEINLCDEVTVEFEEYGIEEKAKIVKTKYNALLDRYDTLEIGSLRNSYKSTLDSITDKIEENKTVVNSKITQIREEILKDYFSDQAYTYNLETGNKYGLPAGTYSYDRPIDQNPTKVIYLGAGKLMIANSKTTDGMWDFTTMATGDGLIGDAIVTNSITANKLAADVGQELDISSNVAITSRVSKTEILTDPEIQEALKGDNGEPAYLHTAWATNATGTSGFSTTVSTDKTYLGTYTDYTSADSTDPAKYSWVKIKGTDGQDSVVYVAYADSADGTENFSLTPGNRKYMGVYSGIDRQSLIDKINSPTTPERNLISRSEEKVGYIDQNGNVFEGGKLGHAYVIFQATENTSYYFNRSDIATTSDKYWRIGFYDSEGDIISRLSYIVPEVTRKTPAGTITIKVSYPILETIQINQSTTAMPWTSSPEDALAEFDAKLANPDSYQWSLIKGTDGKDGTDGQTSYLHTAWANVKNLDVEKGPFYTTISEDIPYVRIRAKLYSDPDYDFQFVVAYKDMAGETYLWMINEPESLDYRIITLADGVVIEEPVKTDILTVLLGGLGMTLEDVPKGVMALDWSKAVIIDLVEMFNITNFSTTESEGRTHIGTYTDFISSDSTDPAKYNWSLIKGVDGKDGADGQSVSKVTTQYYLSTSKTSVTGGSWDTALPAWKKNTYIWTRLKIDYINPTKTEYTTEVLDTVNNALNEVYNSGIILPSQKPQLLIKLAEIVEEYKVLNTEDNKKLDEWTAYQSAYNSLSSTLSVLTANMDSTSDLNANDFKMLNATYAIAYSNLSQAIDVRIAQDLDKLESRVHEAEQKIGDKSIESRVADIKTYVSGKIDTSESKVMQNAKEIKETLETSIAGLNGEMQEVRNYFSFKTDDGNDGYLELGSSEDALKLRQWRNRISFMNGEIEEAYFSNQAMHVNSVKTGRYEFKTPSKTKFEAWYYEE